MWCWRVDVGGDGEEIVVDRGRAVLWRGDARLLWGWCGVVGQGLEAGFVRHE